MTRTPSRIVLPLLGLSLFSGCLDPGVGTAIELQYSRNFVTYRPSDGARIEVLDEFHASVALDGSCQATLEQRVLARPDTPPETHTLDCVPILDPENTNSRTVELSLRGPQDEASITYIFRIEPGSDPALAALRAADGTEYPIEAPSSDDQPLEMRPAGNLENSCGEIRIDFAGHRLTQRMATDPENLNAFSIPGDLNSVLKEEYIRDLDPARPWTGVAPLDFLDMDALRTQEAAVISQSASSTLLGIPCPYQGTFRIDHAVRVPRTRISLAPLLDPEGTQEWNLDYEEDSFVKMDAQISGRILPTVDESGLSWKLAGDSRVAASGQYQLQKEQVENLRLNTERKSHRIRLSGNGTFETAMRLDELAESAQIDSSGEVTLILGSPPIEVEIQESSLDLLTEERSEAFRKRRIFFPGKYTQVGWPSDTVEFSRYSEPRLGIRATLHDEADLPAFWTSAIHLEIRP